MFSWCPPVENLLTAAQEIKDLYTGDLARSHGNLYIKEDLQHFNLYNGARLTIYASAYTPEFND
jgi:hypothetical protein